MAALMTGHVRTILTCVVIVALSALFIGFLVGYLKQKNLVEELKATTTTTSATTTENTVVTTLLPEDIRLDGHVVPTLYRLEIRSDPRQEHYNGTVTIDVSTKSEPLTEIRLHCQDSLIIHQAVIVNSTIKLECRQKSPGDFCIFKPAAGTGRTFPASNFTIQIVFSSLFKTGQIYGFYRAGYETINNERRYITATKFEPTYARIAFPCFDEPHFKAPFEISIVHPGTFVAISNELETETNLLPDGIWNRTVFRRTPPMATYLVAFIISDFRYTETRTGRGLRVRAYARPDQVAKTRYALEAATEILSFYENYTDLKYALSKMDLIGLPEFVSGAMENWGLVTYKETAILLDEQSSSESDRNHIAAVVAHEFSHMWFGNLVTLKWWDDLWLNEGFATFIEYFGQDHLNRSWNVWKTFQITDQMQAFNADSVSTAHPLVGTTVLTPDQCTAMFDTISYQKGATILNMFHDIIGDENFRSVCRNYLKEKQYQAVETNDVMPYFYPHIKNATGIDGEQFVDKWLHVNGFPVLELERPLIPNSQYYKPRSNKLVVKQFTYDKEQTPPEEPWSIQITFVHPTRQGSFVMTEKEAIVPLDWPLEKTDWLKLNRDGRGYYLVNYQPDDWDKFIEKLKQNPDTFSVADRTNLLRDADFLAQISRFPYERLFRMWEYLKKESHYVPWSVASNSIRTVGANLANYGAISAKFRNFAKSLVADQFDAAMESASAAPTFEQIKFQGQIISLACSLGYDRCMQMISGRFRAWLDNGTKPDPNLKSQIYNYGMMSAGSNAEQDWHRLWDLYESEKDAQEKSRLMAALTSTENKDLLAQLISYSEDSAKINNENFFSVHQGIARNSIVGRDLIWSYIKNNWKKLVERFTLNDRRLGNYVRMVCMGFGTDAQLQEMMDFFNRYPDAGAGAGARKDAIERVKNNIQWLQDNSEEIEKVLSDRDRYQHPWLEWRLDDRIRPLHYQLNLSVDVDGEQFAGNVRIEIDIQRPIRYLIVHSKDLNISKSTVYTKNDMIPVSRDDDSFAYEPNQFWVVPMAKILLAGSYVAEFRYTAKLSKELSGLYLSRYWPNASPNEVIKLATTQFQATFARKAFPCFDEPQFKSTFDLSVEHRANYSAISNMPVDYVESIAGDLKRTVFQRSAKMPTYLLALVVSDFSCRSHPEIQNISLCTYDPDINLPKTNYSLSIAAKILDYYSRVYFEIGYPLPKLDLISIPDFSMGAMENWGLVTFRDIYVLYDPQETSSAAKMRIGSIVAHELAHMWFGNLVTMKWWDDLWLNEGFATFMEYKASAYVEPGWNFLDQFAIDEILQVYEADSMPSTHPVLTNVANADAIQAVFDSVTYAKGATIIRMLESVIGEETFRTGIRNYMKAHLYSNTLTGDLWSALTAVDTHKLDIAQFMDTWVRREGFPVVTVRTLANGTLTLTQDRFLKDFSTSNSSYIWSIPITYRLFRSEFPEAVESVNSFMFDTKHSNQIQLANADGFDLIKINIDHKGLYLVNYPTAVWSRWAERLKNGSIRNSLSPLDRNNLLVDAFYLARSGRLGYQYAFGVAESLKKERSFIVWRTAFDLLQHLRTFLVSPTDPGVPYRDWIQRELLSDSIYDELGWEWSDPGEDLNRRQLRALVLDLACTYEYKDCLSKATERFDEFMANSDNASLVDPDIFSLMMSHTMSQSGNETKFEFLHDQYVKAATTNKKMQFLRAMTAVRDTKMLQKLIEDSLNVNYIRPQDFFTFLQYLSSNPVGLDLAWTFYRDNYGEISSRYGLGDSNLGRAVYRFAKYFTDERRRQEVREFFDRHPEAGAGALYRQQTMDLLEANLRWSKMFYNDVNQYLTVRCQDQLCPWKRYRLNETIKPENYELTIQINTTTNRYNGTVKIQIKIAEPTRYIILHAASILDVTASSVLCSGKEMSTSGSGFRYAALEFYIIPLSDEVHGECQVQTSFNGSLLLGGMVGLYRGWYENSNTTTNLAATQFQSTHARKAFPCFDEPSFRSTFDITVIHEPEMITTLSNMNQLEAQETTPEGWRITKFARTPKMVTYLVAILVSDFHCTRKPMQGNRFPIQTCSSKVYDKRKHDYSLTVAAKVLEHYETFSAINFTMPKLDQIGLPQFSAGAMENWGLVKYRENRLLWTEDQDTAEDQEKVCAIIAHELAHMWFGNLVTCKFWGDLWLNEAFASYMEYSAVDYAEPEWNAWGMLAYEDTYGAILGDYEEYSQPLIRSVDSPGQMSYSTRIVYNKGATILNMFNRTMGPENFAKSIRDYLKRFSNDVVESQDLFNSLLTYWTQPVNGTKFFESWTKQPGFPYVNLTRDTETGKWTYVQERFLRTGVKPANEINYVIPFSFYSVGDDNATLKTSAVEFFEEKSGSVFGGNLDGLVKANPDFSGYYFVNYPAEHWSRLSERMRNNEHGFVQSLTVNDRVELILSSYFLSRARLAPYFTAFELFNYLVHETHYIPWKLHINLISTLAWEMERTEYRETYFRFERRLLSAQYQDSFWNDSGNTIEKIFKRDIVTNTCGVGHRQCMDEARRRFQSWKQNSTSDSIPPNFRLTTLSYGIRSSSDPTDYEFVWKKFLSAPPNAKPDIRPIYLEALSYIPDSGIAQQYLDRALDETLVPVDMFVTFFKHHIHRIEHEPMAWKYLEDNYSMLARKLSMQQMESILAVFAEHAVTEKRRDEIERFLQREKNPKTGTALIYAENSMVMARIKYNIEWMAQNKKKIGEWLVANACGSQLKPEPCPWAELQLPADGVKPSRYDLTIQVDLSADTYNGTVKITAEATGTKFRYIVLHAAEMLKVDLISVRQLFGQNQTITDVDMFRYTPNHYLVLEFGSEQDPGRYELQFGFRANLLDSGLSGLYISNYTTTDDGGKQTSQKIASTQFEFYDARKVFPCFDEPSLKSTFVVTIVHRKEMNTTLSNMEAIEEHKATGEQSTGWVSTRFQETPQMTTYLLAMVISDFVCKQIEDGSMKYRICAARTQQHQFDFSLERAPQCVRHLEQRLKVNMTVERGLNKIDLIAIPDFYYGAMENWGLITFRETALLYHPDESTTERKMGILNTVAHELAHFWFGNLVTCKWWNYIFLNEAFATYMQYTTLDSVEPKWRVFDMFLVGDFQPALVADSKDNHPIIRNVRETREIDQADAKIIYSKGATILRMVEFVMGTENFYSALSDYLRTNEYQSVVPEDLLNVLDQHVDSMGSGRNISWFLDEWLRNDGFPYINVTQNDDGTYGLVQSRFWLQKSSKKNATETVWKIPLSYVDSGENKPKIEYLTEKESKLTLPMQPTKLNVGHHGFYLTNYPSEWWQTFTEQLQQNHGSFSILDRTGLLLDAFYLAQAHLLPYSVPLNLAKYLSQETELTPFLVAIDQLTFIKKYADQSEENREGYRKYLQELIRPVYEKLEWQDQGEDLERRFRATIFDFSCYNGIPDCLEKCQEKFPKWMEAKTNGTAVAVPPNFLKTVLKYGMGNDSNRWMFVWSQYGKEPSATIKGIYIEALANANDPKLLQMLLNQALEGKSIRSQDAFSTLNAVARSNSPVALQTFWQFFQQNYLRMVAPNAPFKLDRVGQLLTQLSRSGLKKKDLVDFLAQNRGVGLTTQQRQQVLNSIDANMEWTRRAMTEVERFLLCGSDHCPVTDFRLNPNVYPKNYKLTMAPNLENATFSGSVDIEVEVSKETINYVIVHAGNDLDITNSTVNIKGSDTELLIEQTFRYKRYEFWVLKMAAPIVPPQTIELHFRFESKLATDEVGFYLSQYYDPKEKKEVKLAATQFQDVYARRAFPCFDEPSFKSVFEVTIQHDIRYRVLSNTPKIDEETSSGISQFEPTPSMVTYLLAFIVSDFECQSNQIESNVHVQVCASPPEVSNVAYALAIAPNLIETFESRLNHSYQLAKMDLVAIPDFRAGAMENWGLLTFRETNLLWNEKTSSAANKMSIAAVVAHEITHMWFGNMLTCDWWTDLWLNEAFASYLEWFSVDTIEPGWEYKQLFYTTDYMPGMEADASITAHPLSRAPITSPDDIPYITPIIYQKGSSILRMFEFVLGTEQFFQRLQEYLETYKYQTVTAEKFFSIVSQAKVDELDDTGSFLRSWTLKPGFPYLNVSLLSANGTFLVTQQRFLSSGIKSATGDSDESQTWIVPLSFYVDGDCKTIFINESTTTFSVPTPPADNPVPVKFNCDSQGFYIVNYELDVWKNLTALFNDSQAMSKLSWTAQDYSHLLYDSFRLANVDLVPFDIVMDLLAILANGKHTVPVWITGATIFGKLSPYFQSSTESALDQAMNRAFLAYAVDLSRNAYGQFGLQNIENESVMDQRLRSTVTAFACRYGYDLCRAEAQVQFKKWRQMAQELSPNTITTVLRYAIQDSQDETDWHFLWEQYLNAHSTSVKLNYLQGLAQTSNEKLLQLLLERANNQTLVRRQDYLSLYSYVLRTPIGFRTGWKFFQNNYRTILAERLSRTYMGRLVNSFAGYLHTAGQKLEFQTFFESHRDHGVSDTYLRQAFETIDNQIIWAKKYRYTLYRWLAGRGQ